MEQAKLKHCPFCGYENPKITEKRSGVNRRTGDSYQVLCGRCKARGPLFTAHYMRLGEFGRYEYIPNLITQQEIIQKAKDTWNRRVNDAE